MLDCHLTILGILNPPVLLRLPIVMVFLAATPRTAKHARAWYSVQSCGSAAIAVAFYPVVFHAPRLIVISTVTIISRHKASAFDRWRDRVDVGVHPRVDLGDVVRELGIASEQIERALSSRARTAFYGPSTIHK